MTTSTRTPVYPERLMATLPTMNIVGTRVKPFSNEDILALSVKSLTSTDMMGSGTVNDKVMGPIREMDTCDTCNQAYLNCPGHFAHIELNYHFINPEFMKKAIFVLTCVCHGCGELLLSDKAVEDVVTTAPARLQRLAELSESLKCSRRHDDRFVPCNKNPTFPIKLNKNQHILRCAYSAKSGGTTMPFEINTTIQLFQAISLDPVKCRKLGFTGSTRPIDFVIRSMVVLPPCVRPLINQNCEEKFDHLTTCYKAVISINEKLENASGVNEVKNLQRELYDVVTHTMDNSDGTYKHGRSEPIKSAKERLISKSGELRGSQIKRNDYTARTVAGSDPTSDAAYISVPEWFRTLHTIVEVVSVRNIDYITSLYNNNQLVEIKYAQGNRSGRAFTLNERTRDNLPPPEIGDSVKRWGENNDVVIFGRQPTLTKNSIMSAKVNYCADRKTLGIPSSLTSAFNADFDGDEMNVSMMQSILGRAEARFIMSAEALIINPKNSAPVVGIMYNCLTGAYLLTRRLELFDDDDYFKALKALTLRPEDDALGSYPMAERLASLPERLERHGIHPRSPHGLFSVVLPSNFYYKRATVLIRNGVLVSGTLTKADLGAVKRGIIHFMALNYKPKTVLNFIVEASKLLEWYVERHGFSIGYGDISTNDTAEVSARIDIEVRKSQKRLDVVDSSDPRLRDFSVNMIINDLSYRCDLIPMEHIDPHNPLNVMAASGTKGSERTIAQVSGAVGQQYIYGRLPKMNITSKSRMLPFFRSGETSLESGGFIKSSFMKGLRPSESFMHFMASRVGLIDTNSKTADTGALQHRMVRVFEDNVIDGKRSFVIADKVINHQLNDGHAPNKLIQVKVVGLHRPIYDYIDLSAEIEQIESEL